MPDPRATVADVVRVLDAAYPPALAEDWDLGIGLTCGDPADPVDRVLLAVDADAVTAAEAVEVGAQLLVTHHPLLFRAVRSVAAGPGPAGVVHRLQRAGIAHLAAHTNADKARDGVNDALAELLELRDVRPLVPDAGEPLDKIVVFVPDGDAPAMVSALAAAGAGTIGDYAEAAWTSPGTGQFRPMAGAHPAIGTVGSLERVPEVRVEMVAPRSARDRVVAALRTAHRYEEPAFDVLALQPVDAAATGSGRIGRLPATTTLRDFAGTVARLLPGTATGLRVRGEPDAPVSTVAVCGGSGGSFLPDVLRSGADVYLSSDLGHHTAGDVPTGAGGPALVDVAHWAGEWPWLRRAAARIEAALDGSVSTTVSVRRTDPWTFRVASPGQP
ncbi:Nif3-like dinuclear metal center hexameric protein [Nakamurella endophytica]|uniref:GTP cyclohydrolase 1 type 2 homolog n=1 Tax=Nakamurella endophytica TaxID=1748367 RepID=A0A917WN34_9ACTN|nr:Nif3-like dinuclear metal center hexameric protein [Nakamurella endophytica]GGM17781.1 GTP cyclohydrolase 1 type 2 [Nakamurella endophytica]